MKVLTAHCCSARSTFARPPTESYRRRRPQDPNPESDPSGTVPPARRLAVHPHLAGVHYREHARIPWKDEIQVAEWHAQLDAAVDRRVARIALRIERPKSSRSPNECCLMKRILAEDFRRSGAENQDRLRRERQRNIGPAVGPERAERLGHVPDGREDAAGEIDQRALPRIGDLVARIVAQ